MHYDKPMKHILVYSLVIHLSKTVQTIKIGEASQGGLL